MDEVKSKVAVNTFLVFIIPLIIILFKIIPKLVDWCVSKYQILSGNDADKIAQAVKIKEEMKSISMVDEFAKYAKLQRRLNQISLDLDSTAQARQLIQVKAKTSVTMIMYGLTAIIYFALLFFIGIRTPVFVVPKHWFFPLSVVLSYPTGVEGAISIPVWTVTMRNVISLLIR